MGLYDYVAKNNVINCILLFFRYLTILQQALCNFDLQLLIALPANSVNVQ